MSLEKRPSRRRHDDSKNGHSSTDEDDQELATDTIKDSTRSRLPFAQSAWLSLYRISTAIFLMMWIYLSPNTPISCLLQDSDGASMSLLVSCQGQTCSGWFHTHSPIPANRGLLAITQFAIGTSVLWLWVAFMDLLALFPSRGKRLKERSEKPRSRWHISKYLPSMRDFQDTLSSLVKFGEALGILCVAILSIGVFAILIMTMGSTKDLGVGAYMCVGPLLFIASQGMAPSADVMADEKKRVLKWAYRIWFFPVLLPMKLFNRRARHKAKRLEASHASDLS